MQAVNGTHPGAPSSLDEAGITVPDTIVKRDGRVVPFEIGRIENALARCFASFGREPATSIEDLAQRVMNIVAAKGGQPSVETVQDIAQILWFKWKGRRLFRMAPLHHHFELIGWPEQKITIRFWIVGGLSALVGVAFYLGTRGTLR